MIISNAGLMIYHVMIAVNQTIPSHNKHHNTEHCLANMDRRILKEDVFFLNLVLDSQDIMRCRLYDTIIKEQISSFEVFFLMLSQRGFFFFPQISLKLLFDNICY